MGIQMTWDDTQPIVHIRFERQWTWDELYAVQTRFADMVEPTDDKADVLVDLSQFRNLGSGFSMRKLNEYVTKPHPKARFVIVYGASPVLVPIINTILRPIHGYNLSLATNEAEAYSLLTTLHERAKTEQ